MADLVKVYSPASSAGKVNVIFVHGLGGDIRETWMCDPADASTLWPVWLGEDSGCPIWLLGYDAAVSGWTDVAMALPQQGTNVLDRLMIEPELKGAPLLMVGHSLGGLVIKMALANAMNQGIKRYEPFVEQLKGVAFLATPHQGSELASLATAIRLLRPNEEVANLRRDDPYLTNLGQQFRAAHLKLGFGVRVFTETRGITIKRRIFGLQIWPRVMVVASSSGDPDVAGESAVPLPEDHFSICKPHDRSAQVYKSTLDFVNEVQRAVTANARPAEAAAAPATATAQPATASAKSAPPTRPAVFAWKGKPTDVYLAFSAYGLGSSASVVAACAYVTTDEPHDLTAQLGRWRDQLSRDPLIPAAGRARAQSGTLDELVADPSMQGRILGWLAVTPFSAYVYYGFRVKLKGYDDSKLYNLFYLEPLTRRMSKKDERFVRVQGNYASMGTLVAGALGQVAERFHRTLESPQTSGKDTQALVDLAGLVAWATAQHLAQPNDGAITAIFASLRTRIRFAQDVVTGAEHLRDKNPLP